MRSTITATATAMTATKIVDDTPILHVEWFEFAPVQMTLKKRKVLVLFLLMIRGVNGDTYPRSKIP